MNKKNSFKTDSELSHPSISLWKRVMNVTFDSGRSFIEDDCYSKASALTFYSLLSIVPILAVLFGIAKGFGFENDLQIEITEHFSEQQEIIEKLIQFAHSWLLTVKGGVIAGIGTFALLWSVFGLLSNIETALNSIWKTRISRSYSRKISDYLATMLICPIFLVTSSSITLFLNTQIAHSSHDYYLLEVFGPFLHFTLKLFPFFLSIALFTFVYLFLPNTKIYLRSALIGAILAGTAFQAWQWIYIRFQMSASNYGAIYGSFAALPLFLIWLQVSWLIFLAGAEIAFEIENDLFIPNRRITPIRLNALALLITFRCIEAFAKGEKAVTDRSLSHELGLSLYHLQGILEALQKEAILSSVSYHNKTIGYQPARAIHLITYASVIKAIEKSQELMASIQESEELERIQNFLNQFEEDVERSEENQPLYSNQKNL